MDLLYLFYTRMFLIAIFSYSYHSTIIKFDIWKDWVTDLNNFEWRRNVFGYMASDLEGQESRRCTSAMKNLCSFWWASCLTPTEKDIVSHHLCHLPQVISGTNNKPHVNLHSTLCASFFTGRHSSPIDILRSQSFFPPPDTIVHPSLQYPPLPDRNLTSSSLPAVTLWKS